MTAARCVALMICALGITPALAAPVPLGDPFYVRYGESVELTHGVKLKLVGVKEGRCSGTCVWQGEAFVEIELQAVGQTARGTITTEKPNGTVLAHRVKLLGLYPWPRGEETPTKEYVALLRVADTVPGSAKPLANRAEALAAASRFVAAYRRAANQVCADWQKRRLVSYLEEGLCTQIGKVAQTADAVNEDAGGWHLYFLIDDPLMRTQMNERIYLWVPTWKNPADALDQVREWDVVVLPCGVTLLNEARGGCNAPPR